MNHIWQALNANVECASLELCKLIFQSECPIFQGNGSVNPYVGPVIHGYEFCCFCA